MGITPACAGKTLETTTLPVELRDHPRMCGKDYLVLFQRRQQQGSPPHVRERLFNMSMPPFILRITPACAGKTAACLRPQRPDGDHPRMCGKDDDYRVLRQLRQGSPPHVRERLYAGYYALRDYRITPACAGKTDHGNHGPEQPEDHPRMCGKDTDAKAIDGSGEGSPPHVRERLDLRFWAVVEYGITPACAGKTYVHTSPPG